ncbi:MAG: hypothetical protein HS111_37345 [Kofleriaceae bacterium]|nr:hypothetical protein [Kofleriaceae bacterium]MCL4226807.1 hypothetical protein [Myxococcales bacterium]
MPFRPAHRGFALVGAALVTLGLGLSVGAGRAAAQAALDDDDGGTAAPAAALYAPPPTKIGVGLRLRNVLIPEGMLEWFVEDAPGGVSNVGFGAELSRRKGDFEVQFGLEYEKLSVTPGIWIEKDKPLPGATADLVRDDDFRWLTAELTFMYHTPIIPQLAVRYGGGAGIGILMGSVRRTDQICTTSSTDSCMDDPAGENDDTPYDLPPVMLVVNAIIGVQIKPTEEIFINVEGGLRTVPFFGITGGYYF